MFCFTLCTIYKPVLTYGGGGDIIRHFPINRLILYLISGVKPYKWRLYTCFSCSFSLLDTTKLRNF